jgi:2-keto-4-pentenoate hydratase/2-oxohepta-3-ene-1,7-dioic acid hydratase in catechol pathway
MRFVQFGEDRLGVLAGDQGERVVDVTDLVERAGSSGNHPQGPQGRLQTLIAHWDTLAPALRDAASSGRGVALDSVRLRAPVTRPGQLVCMAGNYREPGRPDPTFNAFLKATTSVIGQGDTVELPDAEATVFHFEPELALLIGKPASHLKPENAMQCVFGYMQFLDVSARGLPGGFFLGKSWHTFAPLGPLLVTKDEVPDPNNLSVQLSVNGKVRQEFSTADMGRDIAHLLADLTHVLALEPGDVVATGTHHVQLSPIQDGDRVRVSVQGLGPALEVPVHDPLKRTWEVPTPA